MQCTDLFSFLIFSLFYSNGFNFYQSVFGQAGYLHATAGWVGGCKKRLVHFVNGSKVGQETAGAAAAADRAVEGVPTERDSISPCDQACMNPACLA